MIDRVPAGRLIAVLLLVAWIAVGPSAADAQQPGRFKGLSLAAALAKLQQGGLKILFSSDLVRPDMIVVEEPRARWPHEILDELLVAHGLRSQRGPSNAWLVVKAPDLLARASSAPAEGAAPPPRPVLRERVLVQGRRAAERLRRPEVRHTLGADEIESSPELGADPLLPVERLPGVAATEGSGDVNVRGGAGGEVQIILDGLELYAPYHLPERGGPISIIDSRNLDTIGLLGGAFPAEYGGHMSAIVEMDSIVPAADRTTDVAVSSGDARLAAQGGLGDELRWLVSARGGDPSRFLDALGADPGYDPRYGDVFAKVAYRAGDSTTLAIHALAAEDALEGVDDSTVQTVDEPGAFRSRSANHYAWFTIARAWSPRLFSQTVVSLGRLNSEREGSGPLVLEVADSRTTHLWGLKQDWLLESGRQLFKWGLDFKHLRAQYDYQSVATDREPLAIAARPAGSDVGIYVADQLRGSRRWTAEVGLRWDVQTYGPGRSGAVSPRANVAYAIGERSTLRAGWGYFYQPHKIHELQVEDGIAEYFAAERAEHRLVSFERELHSGLELQVSAYQKLMSQLRPRFENLFDPFGLFPEADGDRVRIDARSARAAGVEITLQRLAARRHGWWATYSLARTEDEIAGRWVPRSWDQRHTVNAGVRFRPNDRWDLSLAGSYHSGRPTTPVTAAATPRPDGTIEIVPAIGIRNGARLPAYQRFDLRASRSFPIGSTELRTTLAVTNVFDHENACCVSDFEFRPLADDSIAVTPRLRNGLPRLITFGLGWTF